MATETRTRTQTDEPASAHPPPPSPPTSPPAQSTGQSTTDQSTSQSASQSSSQSASQPSSKRKKTPPLDGKSYYGYLFNKDKTPTALLVALLRAIGKYTEAEIGDKSRPVLDKAKLAAFYRAVGGDYDSLFVEAPDKSISYIWQALGVQHSLQPTEDDFAEPSIPALTLPGFVRWESLQILLGPEEHVPFMQFAVRNWALKHPDTGESFPVDLPNEAFPAVCDPQIDQWHKDCAKRLRSDATPSAARPAPAAAPDPRIHVHFTHVPPGGPPRRGPEMDYFERQRSSNIPFIHIPSRAGPHHNQPPHKRRVDSSSSSSTDERARRRRSFSDYASPQHEKTRPPTHQEPHRPAPVRRHSSQPRHPSASSTDSESDAGPTSPRTRIHRPVRPPVASVRVFPPESPISPPVPQGPARPSHRTEMRQDDARRRSLPSGHFGIRQKVMSFLPGTHDRPRSTSRSDRETDSRPNSARLRPDHPSSRMNRRHSDDPYSSDESGSDASPKHRSRREREREREREKEKLREREKRERELEEERERRSRKDRTHLRPGMTRRTSSAADVERRTREWDVRDRYRDRDRERDHVRDHVKDTRDSRDPRGNLTGDERHRRSWRERERDRERERGGSPVVTGVSGRKYPTEAQQAAWA